jgi:PASTA domain
LEAVAARLTSLLPRVVALTAILVLASATISFAAENTLLTPAPQPEPAEVAQTLVTVPDVRGQAYVFAKGTLEERGFAWRVTGSVHGYSANTVVSQTPAAGTRVVDTGLPTILLGLARNGTYTQEGSPEDASPYPGTAIKLPVRPKPKAKPAALKSKPAAKPKAKPAAKPKAKPKAKVAAKPKAKPKAKPASKPKTKPKAKPAPKPKTKPKAKPAPKPKAKPAPKPKAKPARPPAFTVAGAPTEPHDEIPLPERARRLEAWIRAHPKKTSANVRHWLYQHEWIVTGAKFGWWHGAEAVEILIRVDEQVQRSWGIGAKSEAAARRALAAVRAKQR